MNEVLGKRTGLSKREEESLRRKGSQKKRRNKAQR